METQETATSYVELTSQTYGLIVDAFASGSKRALDYTKSAWEITTQPYPSSLIDSVINENFNRANRLVNLTVGELKAAGLQSGDFVEKLLKQRTKIQDTAGAALRGLLDTYASNLNYIRETTTQQLGDLSKRLEDQKATSGSRN
jgi:hypothetical protein